MPVAQVKAPKREAHKETQTEDPALCRAISRSSVIQTGDVTRLSISITASPHQGLFKEQLRAVLKSLQDAISAAPVRVQVTAQTVFLREASNETLAREMFRQHFGADPVPVTTFVTEPPCNGAELALEAWAIGGRVTIETRGRHFVSLNYNGARWVHVGDIAAHDHPEGVYALTGSIMQRMQAALTEAKAELGDAVRTWFYLGDITEPEGPTQRYKELNRARTDFYKPIHFHKGMLLPDPPRGIYPASTGIGMRGRSLAAQCLTVETSRSDARLLALENPLQTPAYAYHAKYSPQSPKFSRAMALVLGENATTWVSGTASIVNSESRHESDPRRQTEQTIDNIERLVSSDNFRFHGVAKGGADLKQFARVRVYVKRPQDYSVIREVCERRFGCAPTTYLIADVCRPELLVEIEGVVFC